MTLGSLDDDESGAGEEYSTSSIREISRDQFIDDELVSKEQSIDDEEVSRGYSIDDEEASKELCIDDEVNKGKCLSTGQGDDMDVSGSLLGVQRKDVDEIYDLYVKHAKEIGFSVRKTTSRIGRLGTVVGKYYVCSCEGQHKNTTEEGDKKKKRRYVYRSGCSASLRVKLNDAGVYEVTEHRTEHNHPLTRKEWSYLRRSQRSITGEKAVAIEHMISSGMRATDSFRYMVNDAGGVDCVGHTLKDHLNFVHRLKMKAIEGGDAQTLIDIFSQRGVDDPDFFYRVKLDDDGRLSNVFWRDSMMKEDFGIYGDVVVFDTTYRTNKYNLICAPFVGSNNHKKNVMFGCAFISDEKIESFEWLFTTFKKSMEGRAPVTLFTDQDLAIANAIEKIFPDTRHRLCLWHLYNNATGRFGKLKNNKNFKDAFNTCLTGCTSPQQFEEFWKSMMIMYKLEDNAWFERLYLLKEKWCTGLNKNFFEAGIRSSQRSESTNSVIELKAKKTTNLTEFFNIFTSIVQCWRDNEKNDEFQCSRVAPTSTLPMRGIMKHASQVYTITIFKDFENELLKSVSLACKKLSSDGFGTILYSVSEDDDDSSESFDVSFCELDGMVICSCKRYDECGLLCSHCLKIFQMHSIREIPEFYIKRRWTKVAKMHLWDKVSSGLIQSHGAPDLIPWRHKMARKYYNLLKEVEEDVATRKIIEDGFDRDSLAVKAAIAVVQPMETDYQSSSMNVLDPASSVTKGRKKRIKGHLRSTKKKNKDASVSGQSMEFGSKTPNPRLF